MTRVKVFGPGNIGDLRGSTLEWHAGIRGATTEPQASSYALGSPIEHTFENRQSNVLARTEARDTAIKLAGIMADMP